MELAEEDAAAYGALSAALRIDKSDPWRDRTLATAVERAIEVPSAVAATGLNVLRLFENVSELASPYMKTDLGVAAGAMESAVRGAAWMVRANLPMLSSQERAAALGEKARGWIDQAELSRGRIDDRCV